MIFGTENKEREIYVTRIFDEGGMEIIGEIKQKNRTVTMMLANCARSPRERSTLRRCLISTRDG